METPILEPSTTQYTTIFKVQQRNFIGNSGGTNIGEWTFNVDDTNEFIISVWNKAIDVIHRGVMFMTTADGLPDCAWMDEVRPCVLEFTVLHNRAVDLNSSHLEIQYSIVRTDFLKIIDKDCFDKPM